MDIPLGQYLQMIQDGAELGKIAQELLEICREAMGELAHLRAVNAEMVAACERTLDTIRIRAKAQLAIHGIVGDDESYWRKGVGPSMLALYDQVDTALDRAKEER